MRSSRETSHHALAAAPVAPPARRWIVGSLSPRTRTVGHGSWLTPARPPAEHARPVAKVLDRLGAGLVAENRQRICAADNALIPRTSRTTSAECPAAPDDPRKLTREKTCTRGEYRPDAVGPGSVYLALQAGVHRFDPGTLHKFLQIGMFCCLSGRDRHPTTRPWLPPRAVEAGRSRKYPVAVPPAEQDGVHRVAEPDCRDLPA